jgi:hypothetical protein
MAMSSLISRDGILEGHYFLVEVSGHKLESSQARVFVWFSGLIFPFYKMQFMNRLQFSCQSRVEFFLKSASRRDCKKDSSLLLN